MKLQKVEIKYDINGLERSFGVSLCWDGILNKEEFFKL